ncbi:CPBP family intramembrane glutamic endopeptidase [Salinirubellus sp. GCM10025818]|uniref:CPBP family intramembrane glutamic endopeptidase n=1 Tax=Salinirubellus TaxID=2162630 RepID=UPI0030D07B3D
MIERRSGWSRRVRLPFWNRAEQRPRALWRVLGALVVVLSVPSIVGAVVLRPLDLPMSLVQLASNALAALVALVVLLLWARYVDRRELRAYGFRLDGAWWRMLALGALVGLLGWGGALATDLAFGWASVAALLSPGTGGMSFLPSFLSFALAWVFVGVWEEVVFRGIVMRNAIEGLNGTWIPRRWALVGGWVVSSVLFGVLHFGQASSPLALVFWIAAGLVLGLAYLLTGQLAVPIGLHVAFDLGVNNVFGLASVRQAGARVPTLVRPGFTGPDVLVGISGAVNTAWLVVIGLLTVLVVRWRYSLGPRIGPYPGPGN